MNDALEEKREVFALVILHGLLAGKLASGRSFDAVASDAVVQADALIAELDKPAPAAKPA